MFTYDERDKAKANYHPYGHRKCLVVCGSVNVCVWSVITLWLWPMFSTLCFHPLETLLNGEKKVLRIIFTSSQNCKLKPAWHNKSQYNTLMRIFLCRLALVCMRYFFAFCFISILAKLSFFWWISYVIHRSLSSIDFVCVITCLQQTSLQSFHFPFQLMFKL